MQKTHFDKLSASKEHGGMHTENTMVIENARLSMINSPGRPFRICLLPTARCHWSTVIGNAAFDSRKSRTSFHRTPNTFLKVTGQKSMVIGNARLSMQSQRTKTFNYLCREF
jgi:hypothetical protein